MSGEVVCSEAFKKIEEKAKETVESCFFKFDKMVFYFMLFKDGKIMPMGPRIQTMMNGIMGMDKDVFRQAMSIVVKQSEADIVCVLNECWMVCADKDTKDVESIRPSTHPDRKEMVLATIEDRNCVVVLSAPIIRGGIKPQLGKWERHAYSKSDPNVKGRMVDFFNTGVDLGL